MAGGRLSRAKRLQPKPAKPYLILMSLRAIKSCRAKEKNAMTTGTNRIMDEFAKLMTDAAGAAQGVRKEIETAFNAQAERWLNSMDVVKREEFEAVREMAIKARDENEALAGPRRRARSTACCEGQINPVPAQVRCGASGDMPHLR